MCLDTVSELFGPNDNMVVGYKVFLLDDCAPGEVAGEFQGGSYLVGQEYESTSGTLVCNYTDDVYEAGFHIYAAHSAAVKELPRGYDSVVFLVHGWDIRARGRQWGHKIFVAKNMRVVERVK